MSWLNRLEQMALELERASQSELAFSEQAQRALQDAMLHEGFSIEEVSGWFADQVFSGNDIQISFNAAEPSITLWKVPKSRFQIDLYCWSTLDTSPHDHSTEGAIALLQGQTLHIHYQFDAAKELGSGVRLGNLVPRQIEVIDPGHVYAIPAGTAFIHQACHLRSPTFSLIVRLQSEETTNHVYFPPGLSLPNATFYGGSTKKFIAMYEFLRKTRSPYLEKFIKDTVTNPRLDLGLSFLFHLAEKDRGGPYTGLARDHMSKSPVWSEPLEEALRRFQVTYLQRRIPPNSTSEERLCLALMDILGFGDSFFEFVQSRFPNQDALSLVHRWLLGLGARQALRQQTVIPLLKAAERPIDLEGWRAIGEKYLGNEKDRQALDLWKAEQLAQW